MYEVYLTDTFSYKSKLVRCLTNYCILVDTFLDCLGGLYTGVIIFVF